MVSLSSQEDLFVGIGVFFSTTCQSLLVRTKQLLRPLTLMKPAQGGARWLCLMLKVQVGFVC